MSSLNERIACAEDGDRLLASARLRHEVLKLVQRTHQASGPNEARLAEKRGVREPAVHRIPHGDGDVRINTLTQYLHAMGFELTSVLVPAGEPREAVTRRRA